MLSIEFLKIVKRKFNYLYLFLLSLIVIFGIYKENKIATYLDISSEVYIYAYLLKFIIVSLMLLLIINVVFSYREDYKFKVINIIKYANVKSINSIFSKFFSNILIFIIIYIIYFFGVISYYFKDNLDFKMLFSLANIYYLILSICLFVFINVISMLIVSVFNNTNLSLSITFLILLGSKFFVTYLKNIHALFDNLQYTFFGVFPKIVGNIGIDLSHEFYNYNLLLLFINSVIVFIILLGVNRLKFSK